MKSQNSLAVIGVVLLGVGALGSDASGAYIFEIDTDGLDDGILTFNPNFSFGGDTTIASQSATAPLVGATGGDSIFGGDGINMPDTYRYTYNPSVEGDNLPLAPGTALGNGHLATGLAAGGAGRYRVYAGFPLTANVSGGLTTYDVSTLGDTFSVSIDQNSVFMPGDPTPWVLLGEIDYVSGAIDVSQSSVSNTFVSMRAYGLLFEPVPAPGATAMLALAGIGAGRRRRQVLDR